MYSIKQFIYLLILNCLFVSCSVKIKDNLTYLQQKKPKLIPEIFAKDLISMPNQSEFGSVFSKDGKEFFYGVDLDGRAEVRYTKFEKNQWTAPITVISHAEYSYNDPFLSPIMIWLRAFHYKKKKTLLRV